MKHLILKNLLGVAAFLTAGCTGTTRLAWADYPVPDAPYEEMAYTPSSTVFTLWAPTAETVRLSLYTEGEGGKPVEAYALNRREDGLWSIELPGDRAGLFYTFDVKAGGKWLGETPGIDAKAVGVNGRRGAILDLRTTDPEGWADDRRPDFAALGDAIVYEMHHRDFSASPASGSSHPGKYLALTEPGTTNGLGDQTGIDHLKELGITHVHLLPSYDFGSVDETALDRCDYNWGYDPVNYNVPDGSYSTDPCDPAVRIREFKQMVQALHRAGIRVVLDVVYNHTYDLAGSNFERTVPGYFYRQKEDGSPANASGCGNETASDREMMRRYMVESVKYWLKEYHLDGFRFDLMGIHDIETMQAIRAAADQIAPAILIYGEGWAAETPLLPADRAAMKANVSRIPGVAAFCDDLRDALRGPFSDDTKGAFLAGLPGMKESVKFGIAGAIAHPQVDMEQVNYSREPWAAEPQQMIAYVSCHDDMCLVDRLKASAGAADEAELIRLDKLAQTVVLTSQGIPFLFAGEEVMRDKQGVHNSYDSPDAINAIDWTLKHRNRAVFDYYKALIALRKGHPAFRLGSAEAVRERLEFLDTEGDDVVAFRLKGHAGGDAWGEIIVAFNARRTPAPIDIPAGRYTAVCRDGRIDERGLGAVTGPKVIVAPQSALILCR